MSTIHFQPLKEESFKKVTKLSGPKVSCREFHFIGKWRTNTVLP